MKTLFLSFIIISAAFALSGKSILKKQYSSCVISESENNSLACFIDDDPVIMYQIKTQGELFEIKSIISNDPRYYLSGKVDIEGEKMSIFSMKDEKEIKY